MSLDSFGFTPTESRVYEALLRLGPSTGYAVARSAGLARANAYQALDGIVRRGAARKSATIPARYAALSPNAVVAEIERAFRRDLTTLQDHLRRLPATAEGSVDVASHATWERYRDAVVRCVDAARQEVLAIGGPWEPALAAALTGAVARGLTVRAVWLGLPAPDGATVRAVDTAELRAYWSGLPVAVVADRAHALCGVVHEPGVGGGIETSHAAVVPFLRHLLRRELTGGASPG